MPAILPASAINKYYYEIKHTYPAPPEATGLLHGYLRVLAAGEGGALPDRSQPGPRDSVRHRPCRENNSSIIVDEHHEPFDIGGLAYDEEEQNNRVLFEYRNKYDKVKTDTLALEARINHEKEEKQRLEHEHAVLMEAKKDA